MERINNNAYRLDLPEEYGVCTTSNISDLIPFAGGADIEEEELTNLRSNPLQGEGIMQSSLGRNQSLEPSARGSKRIRIELLKKVLGFS